MGGHPLKSSRPDQVPPGIEKAYPWRLGLLVAPAGSGKVRALRNWARQKERELGARLSWYSLQAEHNQPRRFLDDLEVCLHTDHRSGTRQQATEKLEEDSGDLEEGIVETINNLVGLPVPFLLVLDNYDLIQAHPIHEAVKLLVEYMPPGMRLVISSQTEPPLQQARLRARRQLLELGLIDLEVGLIEKNPGEANKLRKD